MAHRWNQMQYETLNLEFDTDRFSSVEMASFAFSANKSMKIAGTRHKHTMMLHAVSVSLS